MCQLLYQQCLIIIYQQIQMHSLKNSVELSRNMLKNRDTNYQQFNYIVIDSDNEEEAIGHPVNIKSIARTTANSLRIFEPLNNKQLHFTRNCNYTSQEFFKSHQVKDINKQIIEVEREIQMVQKECMLLQDMIGDFIEKQTILTVNMHIKERKSAQKKDYQNQISPKRSIQNIGKDKGVLQLEQKIGETSSINMIHYGKQCLQQKDLNSTNLASNVQSQSINLAKFDQLAYAPIKSKRYLKHCQKKSTPKTNISNAKKKLCQNSNRRKSKN